VIRLSCVERQAVYRGRVVLLGGDLSGADTGLDRTLGRSSTKRSILPVMQNRSCSRASFRGSFQQRNHSLSGQTCEPSRFPRPGAGGLATVGHAQGTKTGSEGTKAATPWAGSRQFHSEQERAGRRGSNSTPRIRAATSGAHTPSKTFVRPPTPISRARSDSDQGVRPVRPILAEILPGGLDTSLYLTKPRGMMTRIRSRSAGRGRGSRTCYTAWLIMLLV